MKTIKLVFAVVAALLLSFYAKAKPVFYERLNFSLIAIQQGLDNSQTSANTFVSTIKTFKITSKDVLGLFATALNTNWPVGAQLARSISGDIVVMDKSGVNLIFDVSSGINIGDTNIVFLSAASDGGVFRGKVEYKGANGLQTLTRFGRIDFHLFNERNGITNIDITFGGLNVNESKQKIANVWPGPLYIETINWKDDASVAGNGSFNDGILTLVKGKVTGRAIN